MTTDIARHLARKALIFGDPRRPIVPLRINLLYYKRRGVQNVGDLLSPVLFDYLLRMKGIDRWQPRTKRVALIGSIIQFVSAKATVFGSGFLSQHSVEVFARKKPQLTIRAVRGPLTRNALVEMGYNVPEVYGDPAILMPHFYHRRECKRYEYTVIPHYSKLGKYKGDEHVLSTLTNDWRAFIDAICASQYVISSSLHGIILAEAYGVPAIMLNDTESDDLFKYKDYYYSTGRHSFPMAGSIADALVKRAAVSVPNLAEMRARLLSEFKI